MNAQQRLRIRDWIRVRDGIIRIEQISSTIFVVVYSGYRLELLKITERGVAGEIAHTDVYDARYLPLVEPFELDIK